MFMLLEAPGVKILSFMWGVMISTEDFADAQRRGL